MSAVLVLPQRTRSLVPLYWSLCDVSVLLCTLVKYSQAQHLIFPLYPGSDDMLDEGGLSRLHTSRTSPATTNCQDGEEFSFVP